MQLIRGSVTLPHGTGRDCKVAVLADDDASVAAAHAAKAAVVGGEELLDKIAETKSLAADVVIATPAMVPKLRKVARILGPRCVSWCFALWDANHL
jgi:large subunit ribosomal protein L1